MTLRNARSTLAILGITLSGLLAPAVADGPAIVRHLGGETTQPATGEGAEIDGPQAIQISRDGEILVLDQRRRRVVAFAPGGGGKARFLALPEGSKPTDMIVTAEGLLIWDGAPVAVASDGADPTRLVVTLPASEPDSVSAVRGMFAAMGSRVAEGEPWNRSASVGSDGARTYSSLSDTVGAGIVEATVAVSASTKSASIELRQARTHAPLGRLALDVAGRLGAVNLIAIDGNGRRYVFGEAFGDTIEARPLAFVARFAATGAFEGHYAIPAGTGDRGVRRPVAVSPDGTVYVLRSRAGASDVVAPPFTARTLPSPQPSARAVSAEQRAAVSTTPADDEDTAQRRRHIVERALAFESLTWRVTAEAYGREPDRRCVGHDRQRRPGYLFGTRDQVVRGIPYCWGCMGSLAQISARLEHGALAGNVCTREPPRVDTAGVDCSSFVSAAWGLAGHVTTAVLPTIAAAIADPLDLRPGDVINKPDAHVMLFLGFSRDGLAEVIEAAPTACDGRVCRNTYPLSQMLARGFVPLRYNGLDGSTPEPIEPSTVARRSRPSPRAAGVAARDTTLAAGASTRPPVSATMLRAALLAPPWLIERRPDLAAALAWQKARGPAGIVRTATAKATKAPVRPRTEKR